MQKWMLAALAVVTLTGCARVEPSTVAVGGSRADATVAIQYGPSPQAPNLGETNMKDLAVKKCSVWGYSNADAFGGARRTSCAQFWGQNCLSYNWEAEYQCTVPEGTQPQAL